MLRTLMLAAAFLSVAVSLHAEVQSVPSWTVEGNQASAFFASSIATAGDVNGDGYSDIIVGALGYNHGQNDEGRVFVYLGAPSGISTVAAWTAEGDQAGARFGASVACAGDVNGDGYDDVIIGADSYDNGQADEGRAYVYLGSATGLSSTPDWTKEINQAGANFGSCVAGAGDVNADGYDDVMVGALNYTNGQNFEGGAWVYLGSATGLSSTAVWHGESNTTAGGYGYSVGTAGDVDGDGYSDIIVGAFSMNLASAYYGSSTGPHASADWLGAGDGGGGFGASVSTAGDVNGDGYSDVIVSAPFYTNGQNTEGKVYAYYGSAGGLGNASWVEEGNLATAAFGWSVSVAGDVNGDGYSDVIIGARGVDNGQTDEGRAYVYQGSGTGLAASPVWTADGNLDDANFGMVVAGGGDADGDGYGDVLVGAPYYTDPDVREGRAYLYLGLAGNLSNAAGWTDESDTPGASFGSTLASAGDVNGDGFSDAIVGAFLYTGDQSGEGRAAVYYGSRTGLPASPSWATYGNQTSALYGYAVGSAGDVNGDGYGDVIVGSTLYDNSNQNEGQAFVYYGSSGGLSVSPAWTAHGGQDNAWFAWAAAAAGDVNGDGYGDVIIGAPDYDNGQIDEGRAYLYLGSSTGLALSPAWTFESDQAGANAGFSVHSAGDVNGDGYSDVIVGAPEYSNGQNREGRAWLFLGSARGLASSPAWTGESDQANSNYGICVATAGDVNGDGYSDVIIGASTFDISYTDEGKVYVYLGGASGLQSSPSWTRYGLQDGARLGESVACAGDVNGDGLSDVILGAAYLDDGSVDEGEAALFLGTAAGPATTPAWTGQSNQANARYGAAVAGAGDVNGDGFSDALIGAPDFDNGQSGEGRAYLNYGNERDGLDRVPLQRRANETAPVDLLGKSESTSSFRLHTRARTPEGRGLVQVQWEVKPLGSPFDGTGIGSSDFYDTGAPDALGSSITLRPLVTGLNIDTPYHWRLRIRTRSPFFPYSAWLTHPGNNLTETDIRTGGSVSSVPVAALDASGLNLRVTNPLIRSGDIHYRLPSAAKVRLEVFDLSGRLVSSLAEGAQEAGEHRIQWDARGSEGRRVAAGVYLVRLSAGGEMDARTEARKVIVAP